MSEKTQISAGGKTIEIFTGAPGSPVIYLNTFEGEGEAVFEAMKK